MQLIIDVIRSFRPTQWIKNGIVLAGLIFSAKFTDPAMDLKAFAAFVGFCLLSSAVYLFNDVQDVEFDRIHPKKAKRPIASGKVSTQLALTLSVFLSIAGVIISFGINSKLGTVATGYLILNIFYSKILKRIVIIDVMTIAIGFVFRAAAGAYAVDVSISAWLLICTILLALFLGFTKRRYEVVLLDENATQHRLILDQYSLPFMDQMISVVTASTLVIYTIYTVTFKNYHNGTDPKLEYTIPFVIYGIFRYLYIVYHKAEGGSPTESILTDRPLMINTILWLLTVLILFYAV